MDGKSATWRCIGARGAAGVLVLLAFGLLSGRAAWSQEKSDDSPEVKRTIDEATAAIARKDYGTATQLLEKAAQEHPQNRDIQYQLGMAYRAQSDWGKALTAFQKASQLANDKDLEAARKVAETYERMKNDTEALRWSEKALALDPQDLDLQERVSKLKERTGAGAKPGPKADGVDFAALARTGVIGLVPPDRRNIAHLAAVGALVVLLGFVYAYYRARFRPPLTADERWKIAKACALVVVLGYLIVWGYEPHWRMVVAGLFVVGILAKGAPGGAPKPAAGGGASGGSAAKQRLGRIYLDHLRREGYTPTVDGDGDIVFQHEGGNFIVIIEPGDEVFFRLVFPNFWKIENALEREKAVRAAVTATGKIKVAKVYVLPDGSNVWASVEMFQASPDRFLATFRRSLGAIRSAVNAFREAIESDTGGPGF